MHSHMLWRTAATVTAMGTLCLTTACGGGQQQAPRAAPPETQAQPPTSETQTTSTEVQGGAYGTPGTPPTAPTGQGTGAGTQTTGQMGQGAPTTTGATVGTTSELANLSDEQIVAITIAANTGEVEQSHLAKDHAQNAQVKKFADRMVADHGQANRDEQRLVTKMKVTPAQTTTSQRLSSDSKQLVETLKGEKGAQFDRDYIDAQVRDHRELLDMLDNHLIPQAKNPELKSELQAMRTKVQTHLTEAEDIQRSLMMKR